MSDLPLAGVRVLDFTQVVAGPYATLQLALYGAEVIRIESRARMDPWRFRDANDDPNGSRPFADQSKGKRSVTVNLKTPKGWRSCAAWPRCATWWPRTIAPGVLDRLGLGYEALRAVRPDIVFVEHARASATAARTATT